MFEWRRLEACHEGRMRGSNRGSVTGCVNLEERVNASLPPTFGQPSHYLRLDEKTYMSCIINDRLYFFLTVPLSSRVCSFKCQFWIAIKV